MKGLAARMFAIPHHEKIEQRKDSDQRKAETEGCSPLSTVDPAGISKLRRLSTGSTHSDWRNTNDTVQVMALRWKMCRLAARQHPLAGRLAL
eukprot:6211734-Pleurochrysis_carterae.AAC.4